VLAIAACVFGASRATAIDIAPAAVGITLANAAANGVADRVRVSNTPLAAVDDRYVVVVANILSPALIELAADFNASLLALVRSSSAVCSPASMATSKPRCARCSSWPAPRSTAGQR
jgi:ribosomal protein L11 methylase PrmA